MVVLEEIRNFDYTIYNMHKLLSEILCGVRRSIGVKKGNAKNCENMIAPISFFLGSICFGNVFGKLLIKYLPLA